MSAVLRTLFGIYALLFFCLLLPVAFLCYLMVFTFWSKTSAPAAAHRLSRSWAQVLFFLYGIRTEIRNKEFIDANQTYVFAANHQSLLDIPLFAISCRNTFRFLSKAELARIPLMGYVIRRLYITVNRSDRADRQRSMEIMNQSMQQGVSVFICPEGTRNRTSQPLLPFKDGAFRLAILSQKPLAVLTVLNSGQLLSPNRWLQLKPGIIKAVWSLPIVTAGMTEADLPELKEKVRTMMIENLNGG